MKDERVECIHIQICSINTKLDKSTEKKGKKKLRKKKKNLNMSSFFFYI